MKKFGISVLLITIVMFLPYREILSFCGFYVARADSSLYNSASRVVLSRNEDRTVISMMNDYKGDLKDFAIVVPVPSVLQKEQINVGDPKTIDHLDAFTAPRLVEYFDSNPCDRYREMEMDGVSKSVMVEEKAEGVRANSKSYGVKVEATYTIGEYDIQILSAKYSDGLEGWLKENGYKIPAGASAALKPYIKQKLKFFVAKVNLGEQAKTGLIYLRPIQFAYESERFMLPIRLGMINASGPQELLVYVLTKTGRVETTNYRTVRLPSDIEVPVFVKNEFASFYKSMFDYQSKKENNKVVFTEYFWNMGWCDPCASDPMSNKELKSLGVFWLNDSSRLGGDYPVFVTRLHLKYTNRTFPEDLMFQETGDTENFQGRYIINHPWNGSENECSEAKQYFDQLEKNNDTRAKNLAKITGWDIKTIRSKMNLKQRNESDSNQWWKKIWN